MKKFKFRLQNVLEAREKAFEDRQLELAELQGILLTQTKHLESLYTKQDNTKKSLENLLSESETIDFLMIESHKNHIDSLSKEIQNQHKIIVNTESEVEGKKKEVLEALKAKTMIEKLKEKDYKAFLKDFEQKQAKEIDDIALSRYGKTF